MTYESNIDPYWISAMISGTYFWANTVKNPFLTLTLILFSLSVSAQTELYQWVDENGVKHFSQQPPAHIPDLKSVDIHGAPVVSGGKPQLPVVATNSEDTEVTEAEPEIERVENPEKSAEKCEQARKNISQLTEFRRVRAEDQETGELRYLDDNEKEEQMKNWREREKTYC